VSGTHRAALASGALLLALVVGMESLPRFEASRRILHDGLGPEGGPNGRSVRLLQQLGVTPTPFNWAMRPADAPSSRAVADRFLAPDQWLVSIAIPEESLKDPERGILANAEGRGRDWEQVGWLSLYRGHDLLFATRVGLRVHGSSGRSAGREAFRVIFRPAYGLPHLPPGGPLETAGRPADRFVIRRSQVMAHTQPIAFELSRRIGAIAPAAVPARFVMNGTLRSLPYELTEHVSRRGWGRAHLAHDEFHFYQFRGPRVPSDETAYDGLRAWVATAPAPLRMDHVADRVDLDNLVRHVFTIMFCSTLDWAQGAAVLNLRAPAPRWFWVPWDLDQSFWIRGPEPWKRPSVQLLTAPARTNEQDDVRALLFQRLLREDPQFVQHFTQFVAQTLNHSLTGDYFRDLVGRYERQSVRGESFSAAGLRSFFDHRGDEVIDALAAELGGPRPHTVLVQAPSGVRLRVDGHDHLPPYRGRYFHGQVVTLEAFGTDGQARSRWTIDDAERQGEVIRLWADRDLSVRVRD
jgi:hypothetical protein